MRALVAMALLVASIAVAPGCRDTLMRTPAVVSATEVDPFVFTPPAWRGASAPIFIASTRAPSGREEPTRFYSTDRNRLVRLGKAEVEVGVGMTWDELMVASSVDRRDEEPEIRLTGFEEYGELWSSGYPRGASFTRDWIGGELDREPAERFAAEMNRALAVSNRRQMTVYVHGFNTTFAGNCHIAAEFWHYMARDEVLLSFDWPSKGSVFSYQKDKANAELAVRQLRVLLEFLASSTEAERINIIAHSAGSPVVVGALRDLSLKHYGESEEDVRAKLRIGRVVLAAPDMGLDILISAGLDGVRRVADNVAIYASRRDKALGLSADIFGEVRVGSSIGKLEPPQIEAIIESRSQWIDVTNAQARASSFLGHSYYHENPWVSSDLMIFLRVGATPEERGLERDLETGFLVFPDDYEERLPEIVDGLIENYAEDLSTLR